MGSLEYLIDWYLTLGELIQFIERLDVDKYPYDLGRRAKDFSRMLFLSVGTTCDCMVELKCSVPSGWI